MAWTVAPLHPDDADVLGRAHNRVWRATYTGLMPDAVLDDRDDDESVARWTTRAHVHQELGRSAEGAVTSVAHDDAGTPVGWISVGAAREDDAPAPTELWALYVVPEHWGGGVAQALVSHALPDGPAYLWVLRGNERAARFYRKLGFELDGAAREFADTGAHELRMVREA